MFENNFLSGEEIKKLYYKEYSKKAFGIELPLFSKKMFISGHSRYWGNFKIKELGESTFICSEWWKNNFSYYIRCIKEYLIYLKNTIENQ